MCITQTVINGPSPQHFFLQLSFLMSQRHRAAQNITKVKFTFTYSHGFKSNRCSETTTTTKTSVNRRRGVLFVPAWKIRNFPRKNSKFSLKLYIKEIVSVCNRNNVTIDDTISLVIYVIFSMIMKQSLLGRFKRQVMNSAQQSSSENNTHSTRTPGKPLLSMGFNRLSTELIFDTKSFNR